MGRGWKILIGVVIALAVLLGVNALVTGAETKLIQGAGHSPNVEKPAETAALVLAFDKPPEAAKKAAARHELQKRLQNPEAVRKRP